jgi:Putative Mg2+ and Co2+ transporter CorB
MQDGYKHLDNGKKPNLRMNILGSNNFRWVITVIIVSFIISASLSVVSSKILERLHSGFAFFVVLFIILIGIIFDIIGIAVTAAEEAPFHAMASRKYYGAKQSIKLIRNANKVSSICNDVIGDISGVISGTASALIVLNITADKSAFVASIATVVVTGLVAAITIGGKAVGKTIAIENSNYIVYKVGVITAFFSFDKINKSKTKGRTGK